MTDPIADYLTRLRNAIMANHRVVEVPASNLKKEITKILFEKGYILNYKFVEDGPQGTIKVALKYNPKTKESAIRCLKRVSTPGLRKYTGYKDMPRVINGLGIAILSTSRGVMTDKEAADLKIGGEVLCYVYSLEDLNMSRIGKLPISIPAGVTVAQKDGVVSVKGPKGELSQYVDPSIIVKIADNQVVFEIDEKSPVNEKQKQAFHGLYRSLINNMVVGVSEGYKKVLELVGVGYRVSNQGNLIEFTLGYTHPIFIQLPAEIKVETKSERNQNPIIILESCDKALLGLVCAKIRSFRKPEPYKGKGVLFQGEVIRRKSGKSASAK